MMLPRQISHLESRIPSAIEPLLRQVGQMADRMGVAAYAVGGCVRDWLLGLQPITDCDVTIAGDSIQFARAIAEELRGSVAAIHQPFRTATVELSRPLGGGRRAIRFDVAMCRRETYAKPAAYPRVELGTLEEDLFRRDFTVNALAMALNAGAFGTLADPFGGFRDLRGRRLRALHARSFVDDPSRILRGIRFAQRFGLHWEPATKRAAQSAIAAGALGWLNPGRLRKELERMAEEPDPRACLAQLEEYL